MTEQSDAHVQYHCSTIGNEHHLIVREDAYHALIAERDAALAEVERMHKAYFADVDFPAPTPSPEESE